MKGLGAWAYSARSLGICQKKFRFALHVEQSMTLIQDVCLHDPRGVFLLVHIVMNWCLCCSILSDREIRTMAARLHELPLDLQVRVVLSCVLYGVNWNVFSQRTPRTRTHIHTRTHTHTNTHTRAAHTHTHTHTHTQFTRGWNVFFVVFQTLTGLEKIFINCSKYLPMEQLTMPFFSTRETYYDKEMVNSTLCLFTRFCHDNDSFSLCV